MESKNNFIPHSKGETKFIIAKSIEFFYFIKFFIILPQILYTDISNKITEINQVLKQ